MAGMADKWRICQMSDYCRSCTFVFIVTEYRCLRNRVDNNTLKIGIQLDKYVFG